MENMNKLSRRQFFMRSAQTAAGILAATTVTSCTSAEKPSAYDNDNLTEHINMVTWYEVDAGWPEKPKKFEWGAVPGVAVDKKNNIWICTRTKPHVQVYSPDGKFIKAWNHISLKAAHYMKIDHENNIWLSDCGDHFIRKCTQDGKILLTLGTPGQAGEDETHLNKPTDIAISPTGDLFVSDGYGNNRIVHFDAKGRFIKQWGTKGVKPGQFNIPHAIEMDSAGRLYVADRNNARVQIFDQNGNFLAQWRDLIVPWGLWVSDNDDIWVCGCSPMRYRENTNFLSCPPKDQLVARFNTDGKMLQLWTFPKGQDNKEKSGELNWLHGIALDSKGNLYLGDIIGKRAQKFTKHTDPKA